MDEDFMLWNFLEEERERYAGMEGGEASAAAAAAEEEEDEDEEELLEEDEMMEMLAEKFGQRITRQGGNY